jgi:hypothetical protein
MCECSVGVDVRNEARVLPANAIDFHKFLRWNAGSYLHLQREGITKLPWSSGRVPTKCVGWFEAKL